MTGPTTGFPDWHPSSQWRGAVILDSDFNVAAGTTQNFGLFSASQFASVDIIITTNSGSGRASLSASDTGAFLSGSFIQEWILRIAEDLHVRVPLPRDYVELDITAGTGAAWVGHARIQGVNHQPVKEYFGTAFGGVYAAGDTIANGLRANRYPAMLIPGPATVWLSNDAAPNLMQYEIRRLDAQGALAEYIAVWTSVPAAGLVATVELPETGWAFSAFNVSGALRTYYIGVTPRGRTE